MWRLLGHAVSMLPALYTLFLLAAGNLGANPIERLTHLTGWWALVLLLASLAITPLVKISNIKKLMPWRKLLGLYAFFLVCCHFLIYLIFDLSLDFGYLWDDIKDRPYITVGFLAFLMLIPLAVTSTKRFKRMLGKRWFTLHKMVYVIGALALLHFYWRIRADYSEFVFFIAAYLILMGWRLVASGKRLKRKA